MGSYLVRRFLLMALTLFGMSVLIFVMLRLVPGDISDILVDAAGIADPKEKAKIAKELGLDKPIIEQYGLWIGGLSRGDLGFAYVSERPAIEEIAPRIPISGKLALMALFFSVMPILLFIGAGLFFISPGAYSFAGPLDAGPFSASVLVLVYAFTGFEMAVIPAGEVRDPRRNMPIAILTAIGAVTVLYILIQVVCIGTLPELAASQRPLADASGRFLGSAGAGIISAGALVSIIPNLNVVLLAASRLPFAMSERLELPRILSRTHPRFHTPTLSIVLDRGGYAGSDPLGHVPRSRYHKRNCAASGVCGNLCCATGVAPQEGHTGTYVQAKGRNCHCDRLSGPDCVAAIEHHYGRGARRDNRSRSGIAGLFRLQDQTTTRPGSRPQITQMNNRNKDGLKRRDVLNSVPQFSRSCTDRGRLSVKLDLGNLSGKNPILKIGWSRNVI